MLDALKEQKGVETLIKAFIHLAKIYKDIHLTCIGYEQEAVPSINVKII